MIKPILTIYTLLDRSKVYVYAKPEPFGAFSDAPMRVAGLKWHSKGGTVVEAYLPHDSLGYPWYGDRTCVSHSPAP